MSVLAFLTLTDRIEIWQIFTGCVLLGITKAFEMPARQALVVDIVDDRAHLSNAIALNSTIFHGARLTGPMLAGMLIIPMVGEGGCFAAHAVCVIMATPCFAMLRPRPFTPEADHLSLFRKLQEGFVYTFGFPPVRALMLLLTAFALLGQAYNTLLPIFAADILGGDERTYGQLLGATGLGAVVSAIRLASRKNVLGLGRIIFQSVLLFGLALILFSWSRIVPLALVLQFCAGMAGINVMVGSNTILQTLVEDRLRGRVMSLMGMVFMGSMPLGALLYGKAADGLGAPLAVTIGASGCILAGLVFRFHLPELRRIARPVYEARGILPMPSQGM
jgi:MFS family permease